MDYEENIVPLPIINVASMLPFGATLRPLLNDSCLSDSDINNILKSRGVFVGDSDKKNTIPLMLTMVLSPKEFEQLQEKQATKEDSPKHRNSVVKGKSRSVLTSIIDGFVVDVDKVEKMNPDVCINSPMIFGYVSENQIQLEYNIVRTDLTRDWVRPLSTHSGKIVVSKDTSSAEVKVCNEYTSKETDDINKKIIDDVVSYLREKGEVNEKLKTICASDFSNRERFNFMLSLAQSSKDGTFEFIEIKDVEIGPDPENPPHNPNSVIQQNVKKIIINGNGLESNAILTNDSDKDNLLLRSIEAKYNFNCNGARGSCILQYGFMHFFRNQNTSQEFQVALPFINTKSGNKASLKDFILKKFESIKIEQLENGKMKSY